MTRAKRVDGNQPEIVDALREADCIVDITSGQGDGFPDLVVWRRRDGRVFTVEVKMPDGRLTQAETRYVVSHVVGSHRIFTTAEDAVKGILEAK